MYPFITEDLQMPHWGETVKLCIPRRWYIFHKPDLYRPDSSLEMVCWIAVSFLLKPECVLLILKATHSLADLYIIIPTEHSFECMGLKNISTEYGEHCEVKPCYFRTMIQHTTSQDNTKWEQNITECKKVQYFSRGQDHRNRENKQK